MIGIDVGSAGVRVVDVQTARGGDRILKRYAQEALPGGAVRAGVVHDEDAVVKALKQAFRSAKIHGRRAALAATSAQAVVREISMPHLSRKEREGALPHLARDVLPIPIERAVLDFAPTSAPEGGQVTGLLVGMPADVVAGLVAAVEKAGVAVESVDFAAFAALRSLPPASPTAAACVTLDLGASTTTLLVEHGGSPQLVRVLARGADDITAAISERLGISHAEAEERKRRASLDTPGDVADVCHDALRPLMSEIRSSLDYLADSTGQRNGCCEMKQALISGGIDCRANMVISVVSRSSSRSVSTRRGGGSSISPARSAARRRWSAAWRGRAVTSTGSRSAGSRARGI